MTATYTTKSYSSQDGAALTTTTEYTFSDGEHWELAVTKTPKKYGFGLLTSTKVLRADVDGGTLRRDSRKNLNAKLDRAVTAALAEQLEDARYASEHGVPVAPAGQPAAEPAAAPTAYRIEPGYEEQAVPLTARQEAVLTALHANLNLTNPFEVLPPVAADHDVSASGSDGDTRFVVDVDPEGYISRLAVRYDLGGAHGWATVPDGSQLSNRIKLVARTARLNTPAPTN